MFANFDFTPRFLFMVLLACNNLQPSKTQGCPVSPCQYGGTCVNNVCSCPPGLTGPTCSNVDCSNFPCFNGGTCMPGPPDMCSCPSGLVQPFCTFSCQNMFFPCVNGTCVGDVCNCDTNFAGPTCESAIAAYLSPSEITVTEGHVGQKGVTIQVCRQPSLEEVPLTVSTSAGSGAGSALPDVDFVNIPFTARQDVTISAGQTCTPVNVFIISDLTHETMSEEVFFFNLHDPQPLSSMVHFVPSNGFTIITITDDDPGCLINPCQSGGTCNDDDLCSCQPGFVGPSCQSTIEVFLSPLEVSVTEGNDGDDISVQIFVCRLQTTLTMTVTVTTSQDSARISSDFAHINTTVTIPSGEFCEPVDISIVSDMIFEPTEEFHLFILPIQLPSSVYVAFGRDTATVTIIDDDEDTDPPVISNCPSDRSVSITTGTSSTSVSWQPPTATDNSGDVTLTSSHQPGDTFSLGPTTVTYTATDGARNTEQCQFVITAIIDIDECSIGSHICDAMTSECMNTIERYRCDCRTGYTGESYSSGQQPTCEDIDECSIGSHICDAMTSECVNTIGSYRCDCRTGYTGDSYSPRQQPTCEETELPIIVNCPDDIIVTAPAEAASIAVSWTSPVASDTSGTVTLTSSQKPGDTFSIGSTQVIYTAIDGAGNMASDCRFTVTVVDPESAGSSVAIIIVAVIVVLIVLILLFLIVIVVRKRKMEDQPDPIDNQPLNDLGKQSGPSGNTYHSSGAVNTALNVTKAKKTKESSAASSSVIDVGGIYGNLEPPSPIRVAEFPEYIISNIDKVEHEFGLLEGSQQKHPWTVAEQEYNRKKNRFRNMYPYDHCRVVLPKLPGDHSSDYYNASFILNERDVRAYIASQGPNKASVDDFWRLIWEQNVQTIVMLANLYEETKERCLQYWPKKENEIQSFGYIDVTWTKTQHFADYVIRTLSVDRGGTIREVKQLHFKEWPDKDIPENAMCLVEFARHCKLIHFKKQTPLLIHCSAGIGRTGTFIGLLSMMDVLLSKEYIDIFAFVNKMRENRVNMIQTKKQYRYLHTCLYEFHLTRDCQISSQILSRFKVHDNKAAILREFELLSEMEMSITNDSIKTGGTKDSLARGNSTDSLETDGSMTREHAPRDRFGNMVPVERRKVFMLSSSPSNPDNYINASFVKSYEKKDAFITTQSPLPNTIEDFWRMIYDHKCRTVVMLNQLDGSDKTCVQYWPDRGSLQYGIMTVTCITTEQQSDYVKRTFDVTLNDSANVISVTHLQLEQWPPNGSPQSVIRLITDAQKLQKEANVDKPLVVHCINGFGRSGVFVTVQSEMERIRATGLVDIFATVKKLRNEHQHMMRKKMDYILCFDFLIEFSKRYGNYENW